MPPARARRHGGRAFCNEVPERPPRRAGRRRLRVGRRPGAGAGRAGRHRRRGRPRLGVAADARADDARRCAWSGSSPTRGRSRSTSRHCRACAPCRTRAAPGTRTTSSPARLLGGRPGAVLPFEVEGGRAAGEAVMDGVTLIERATSIGGHHQRHLAPRLHQPPPAHRRGARADGHPRRADPPGRRLRGRRGPRGRPGAGDPGGGVTLVEGAEPPRRAGSGRRSPRTRRSRRSCGSPSSRTSCTSRRARRSCGLMVALGDEPADGDGVLQPGVRPGHRRLSYVALGLAPRSGSRSARASRGACSGWCGRALWRAVGLTAAAFVVSVGRRRWPLEPIFHGAEEPGLRAERLPRAGPRRRSGSR